MADSTTARITELQASAFEIEYKWKGITIVRPANVYGPFDNFDENNSMVIPALIKKALNSKKTLEVWGDGKPIRDFIYSQDVADGMLMLLKKGIKEPVNLGSGKAVSINDIAKIISQNVPNSPLKIKYIKSKATGDSKRLMSTKRARSYGFNSKVSIEDGIKRTINWYIENGKMNNKKRFNIFS